MSATTRDRTSSSPVSRCSTGLTPIRRQPPSSSIPGRSPASGQSRVGQPYSFELAAESRSAFRPVMSTSSWLPRRRGSLCTSASSWTGRRPAPVTALTPTRSETAPFRGQGSVSWFVSTVLPAAHHRDQLCGSRHRGLRVHLRMTCPLSRPDSSPRPSSQELSGGGCVRQNRRPSPPRDGCRCPG
jgi:hypothetical protein